MAFDCRKKISIEVIVIFLLFTVCTNSFSQSYEDFWDRSAVRIDIYKEKSASAYGNGTGFLYYDYHPISPLQSVILVTCRHVLTNVDSITVHFLVQDLISQAESFETIGYRVRDKGKEIWTGHPDEEFDIAVLRIQLNVTNGKKLRLLNPTIAVSNTCDSIRAGREVLYVGFPNWPGLEKTPIVRQGVIALESSSILGKNQILIEAYALPGNSGGPVFQKYDIAISRDSTSIYLEDETPCLIGIVAAYDRTLEYFYDIKGSAIGALPYHSGLSRVFTFASIQETIDKMNRENP